MEKRGGFRMVTSNLKWTTVSNTEIEEAKFRFEASVFNIEVKKAKYDLEKCKYELKPLSYFADAYHRLRFKRIFVEKSKLPIFQPSQILDINPEPDLYISDKTKTNIDALRVKKGQILLTCSGTVGKCIVVSDTLKDKIFSHDLIRISPHNQNLTGYIYAYLKTHIGQTIITTSNYGAVIQHIEPEHLKEIPIPNPPDELKKEIHEKIMKSFALRDESNDLIKKAEKLLFDTLKLPDFDDLKPNLFNKSDNIQTFSVDFNLLDDRLDASYHLPIVDKIIDTLLDSGAKILPLKQTSNSITMPGIFKRVYVDDTISGVPFLGTSDILEISPNVNKFLSKKHHKDLIKKHLSVKENTVLITDRGTIGNVILVPKYYEDLMWTVSQNVIRINTNLDFSGYIYIFLQSKIGKILSKRETYGAVIDMIDPSNVSKIPIPIIQDSAILKEINDLALEANRLRSEAYYLEQEAIIQVNTDVIYT